MAKYVHHNDVTVEGKPLDYVNTLHIILHKPIGYVTSRKREQEGRIIYDLLPTSFRHRRPPLVAAGRLDKWASGLLVLSQDGELVHQLSTPKRKSGVLGKVYEVKLAHPLVGNEPKLFASGDLKLKSDSKPCKPATLEVIDPVEKLVRITLFEGRYHQLRRMLAVVNNRAVEIKRVATGPLHLGDLSVGKWRPLTQDELEALGIKRREAEEQKKKEEGAEKIKKERERLKERSKDKDRKYILDEDSAAEVAKFAANRSSYDWFSENHKLEARKEEDEGEETEIEKTGYGGIDKEDYDEDNWDSNYAYNNEEEEVYEDEEGEEEEDEWEAEESIRMYDKDEEGEGMDKEYHFGDEDKTTQPFNSKHASPWYKTNRQGTPKFRTNPFVKNTSANRFSQKE